MKYRVNTPKQKVWVTIQQCKNTTKNQALHTFNISIFVRSVALSLSDLSMWMNLSVYRFTISWNISYLPTEKNCQDDNFYLGEMELEEKKGSWCRKKPRRKTRSHIVINIAKFLSNLVVKHNSKKVKTAVNFRKKDNRRKRDWHQSL